MWETIVHAAMTLGYWGVFLSLAVEGVGLPFPGDAALAFFGFLASEERFGLGTLVLVATLGSGTGSIAAFALGKHFGLPLLYKYGRYLLISDRSIEVTSRFSRRYGVFVLLFGRMLPGVRTLSSYVAGIGNLSWPAFLVYSFAGFFLFSAFWICAGYVLGENWETVVSLVKEYLVGTALAVILGGAVLFWIKKRRL